MYMVLVEIALIGSAVVAALITSARWSARPSRRRPSRTTLAVDIATALDPVEQEPTLPLPAPATTRSVPVTDGSRIRGMTRVP